MSSAPRPLYLIQSIQTPLCKVIAQAQGSGIGMGVVWGSEIWILALLSQKYCCKKSLRSKQPYFFLPILRYCEHCVPCTSSPPPVMHLRYDNCVWFEPCLGQLAPPCTPLPSPCDAWVSDMHCPCTPIPSPPPVMHLRYDNCVWFEPCLGQLAPPCTPLPSPCDAWISDMIL